MDGCTIGKTWERLSLLQDTRGLSGNNDVWCKSNARCRKLSSPRVLNLASRLVLHQVSGSSARWKPRRFVFVNEQNSQAEPRNRRNLSIYIRSSHLHLLSLFLPYCTHRQHPDLDIMWLAENNATHSQTHPITYTTLYFPSGLPSATRNCIRILTFRM